MEFYGYKKCGTCREAFKRLQGMGFKLDFQDLVEDPPTKEQLTKWISLRGEGVTPFLNSKGTVYRELGLKDKNLSQTELVDLMSQDGKLIKRPVLVTDHSVILGFDQALYDAL